MSIEEGLTELKQREDDAVGGNIAVSLAALVLPAVGLVELDDGIDYVGDEELEESREVGQPILWRNASGEVVAEEVLPFDWLVDHNQSSIEGERGRSRTDGLALYDELKLFVNEESVSVGLNDMPRTEHSGERLHPLP